MKIYTRTGDDGTTGLFGGPRVAKDDARIESYGTVDELNAVIGVARSLGPSAKLDEQLGFIQHELFCVGAELATPDPAKHDTAIVQGEHVDRLERWMDAHEENLEPLRQFILPGGHPIASQLQLARAVCRRAERRLITLASNPEVRIRSELLIYLNRLSDLLFVQSRVANLEAGRSEIGWQRPSSSAES